MKVIDFPIDKTAPPARRLTRGLSVLRALHDLEAQQIAFDRWIRERLEQIELERISDLLAGQEGA